MSQEVPAFVPRDVVSASTEWQAWKSAAYGAVPAWVHTWLNQPDLGLQSARRQRLVDGKREPAQFDNSWMGYLMEMAPFYGYQPESVQVAAVEQSQVPMVSLPSFRVQDLTTYLPLEFCRGLFAVPFFRVPGTPLVYCGVLEPGFIPHLESTLSWLRSRYVEGSPVVGTLPCVFQYFLVEPRSFSVFLNSIERSAALK